MSDVETRALELCAQLTLEEKLNFLTGPEGFWEGLLELLSHGPVEPFTTTGVPRLGIEPLRHGDGPRGVTLGQSTCFPVAMARAATFDPALEEQVGEAIGREARALGITQLAAPCVEVLRHPGWGRAQETYGEDPSHNGEMGAALVRGAQRHVMACAKHLVCNSIENARFRVDVTVSAELLDDVYLVPYRRVVEEGVAAVMSAYNSVNGEWCGQNHTLLTTLLKEQWGFQGYVVSDFAFSIRDGAAALLAGMDVELPSRLHFGSQLAGAVTSGVIPLARIDDAVSRVIGQQLRFAEQLSLQPPLEVLACAEHRALAREVATRAIVLLSNNPVDGRPVLPVDQERVRRIAVLGRLADLPNLGDRGSSDVHPPYVVTPLEGLRDALAPLGIELIRPAAEGPEAAAAAAAAADLAIVIVGYTAEDEGEGFGGEFPPRELRGLLPPVPAAIAPALEAALSRLGTDAAGPVGRGGDRRKLTLSDTDEALITAVAAANPRTVVAVEAGSAVIMEAWRHRVPAILMLWYPGMEGGHALADIVLGRERPTGRLPFAIPTDERHLPPFDPDADTVDYGPLHGQRLLDHLGVEAAFRFGHGLSY